jgi:DNA ligase-1
MRMPFSFVAKALTAIEGCSGQGSKTIIIEIITNIFRSAIVNFPSELGDILYFLILKLAPDFAAVEIGIGEAVVLKAISKACGKTAKELRDLKKEEGDYGTVT